MSPLARPPILTPALLHAIRTNPSLPQHTWYFIASVTLSALNLPHELPSILSHALAHGAGASDGTKPSLEEQHAIARRMREALVKSAAVTGLPKAINALLALKSATPQHLLDLPPKHFALRKKDVFETPSGRVLERGQRFFDSVYGKISGRVMGQMERSGTEDLGIVGRLMYAYILSQEGVLGKVETSYCLVAGLIPQDVNPQLKGHLKGAVNNGATAEEVGAVRDIVIKICEASGMKRLSADEPIGWGWREEVAKL
ncbi:MAG: hypothetical protein M1834_008033 [Cirrosporium novae-zelandiae]|nr:MAG: hypothetical protein M1834_008033 [Cirrosporium novae-zelandiae]